MRPGQNRRMRGRNNNNNNNNGNRKSPNPLQRSYESNGPDVKVRGTAQRVAEKYLQLARGAQSSGDPVAAENYFQHAEHYYRILLAAQEQMTQQFGHTFQPNRAFVEDADELEEEGEEEAGFQGGQPQGEHQHNGMNGHGGQREDGEGGGQNNGQRFDRPPRQDRQERNFDRNGPRRFDRQDRNDRPDRGDRQDRGDRPDRGERRFDRNDGQNGSYAPRPEAQPGAEQPVQHRAVFQLLLGMHHRDGAVVLHQLLLDAAEDGKIEGITVFAFGGGQQAADGKLPVRCRRSHLNRFFDQRLVAQLRHGPEHVSACFVGCFIGLVVVQNAGYGRRGNLGHACDIADTCHEIRLLFCR